MDTRHILRNLTAAVGIGLLGIGANAQLTLSSSPYQQNFNGVGSGLPTGWSARSGASATALGSVQSFTAGATAWNTSSLGAYNFASANSPAASSDVAGTQSTRTDRALGIRQTGTNDPGAAFALQLTNTSGLTDFSLSFKLMSLDASSPRVTTWNVDYGFGSSPTTWTNATTAPATITTGGSTWGTTNVTVNFGNALDNYTAGTVWIRIAAKSGSSGSGNRASSAIDDVSLSYSEDSPMLSAGAITGFGNQCINTTGGPNQFNISGTNLTDDDVTVSSTMPQYTFATSSGGTYSNPLTISQPGGTLTSTPIYTRFTPTATTTYNGTISVGGGGTASNTTTSVTGTGINSAPSVTTGTASNLTFNSADVAGTITAGGCSGVTAHGIEYSTTNGFTNGSGTQMAGGTLDEGAYTSSLSGLTPCTTYYFKAYATNGAGTTYGAQGSFTTSSIGTPVTTAATAVGASGFTANWGAVSGAASYRLDVSTLPTFSIPGPTTLNEGFNSAPTAPSGWTLTGTYANYTSAGNYGSSSPSLSINTTADVVMTPILSAEATSLSFWIKYNPGSVSTASLLVEAHNGSVWSTLENITSLPTSGTTKTYASLGGNGYVRFRFTYTKPTNSGNLAFDDASITYLGGSTPSFVSGYDNLTVSGTSQVVSGLAAETTYYYRVRAVGGNCTTGNSNTTSVTTTGACTENVTVELRTDANSQEASWEILEQNADVVLCSGGSYPPNITTPITDNCCLPAGCYRLRVMDSGGDGFVTGGYQLRESGPNGRRIIDNFGNFGNGNASAIKNTYENGAFCLPVGDDKLIFSSCDKLDWVDYKFIVVAENPAVSAQYGVSNANSGYEFWFFDPNGSYSFRRFRSHATSDGYGTGALRANHFKVNGWTNSVATPHIPANVLLNVRVRGRVAGNNLAFGPACLFKIDTGLAACPRVKLQDDPANTADYSCGVYRNFGGGSSPANRIYANPPQPVPTVASSSVRYQFRFRIAGEGICIVRPPQTSAQLVLNWTSGTPLQCTKTYEVDVRVSLDGGATWCFGPAGSSQAAACADTEPWGKVCNVTINPCAQPNGGSSSMVIDANSTLMMYPNPNNGDQLFINLSSVEAGVRTVSVDIYDLTGKKVTARTIAVTDGFVKTNLDLDGNLANGMYLVNLTAGSKAYTERLVIQK